MVRGGEPLAARDDRARIALVLIVFALCYVVLATVAHARRAGTWDEPMHLAAGYAALTEGNYLLDPAHPPLVRMWEALPFLLLKPTAVDAPPPPGHPSPQWFGAAYEGARRFLYVDNDADRLLFAARSMVVLLGVVLGVLVFAWVYEWLGLRPAVAALFFYLLAPNLAAHATLATTDFGVTLFVFATVYFLWRLGHRVTVANVTGLALSFSLALVTKFSAVILIPIVMVLMAVRVIEGRIRGRQFATVAAAMAVVSIATVWTVYGFRYRPSSMPTSILAFESPADAAAPIAAMADAVAWLDARHVLPNAFSQGLLYTLASTREWPGYLAGDYSTEGWWYYFPVAIVLKSPAPFIALCLVGLVIVIRHRGATGRDNALFALLPIAMIVGAGMASEFNVGVRHMLPVFPFLLLLAAAATDWLLGVHRRLGRLALGAAALVWLAAFASVYPNTLTFFTYAVGGPRNGRHFLADSNLDWGQHLKLLRRWMDDRGVSHINLAYFGSADPAYYGIDCTHLPGAPTFAAGEIMRPRLPGYVAVSATTLSGVYLSPESRLFYRGLRDRQPVDEIGHTIRVFWLDKWPEPDSAVLDESDIETHVRLADTLLTQFEWTDLAIRHYQVALRHRPDDVQVLIKAGLATVAQGGWAAAAGLFGRAAHVDPENGGVQVLFARALLETGQILEGAQHAGRAVALSPDDPGAHDVLGVAFAMQRRAEDAERAFTRALRLEPNFKPAREHLARLRQH